MARKALIARNQKRIKLTEKYAKKRAELKAKGDWEGLQKLPKNSSPVRIRNRCFITGRANGYIRSVCHAYASVSRRRKDTYRD
jgi:small subunit ribosomal protein S14